VEQVDGLLLFIFGRAGRIDGVHVDYRHGGEQHLGLGLHQLHVPPVPPGTVEEKAVHVNPSCCGYEFSVADICAKGTQRVSIFCQRFQMAFARRVFACQNVWVQNLV